MIFSGENISSLPVKGIKGKYKIKQGLSFVIGEFVSLENNEVIKYNGDLLGLANRKGSGGDIIEVIMPLGE